MQRLDQHFEWLDRRRDHFRPTPTDYVIRQSNVSAMTLCQARVALVIGDPQPPPSEAMFFGTAVHFVVDDFISWYRDEVREMFGLKHGDSPVAEWDWRDVFEYLSLVAREYDALDLAAKFSSAAASKQWTHEVLFSANTWIEQVWLPWGVSLPILGREVELFAPLGWLNGAGVWMSGHPDLWTPDTLVDWKTSGKAWSKGKEFGMVQDDIYAELLSWNYDLELTNNVFVIYDRTRREWGFRPTRITEQSRDAARVRAFAHARDLILGTYSFTPTDIYGKRGWHCTPKFCAAWDQCPARYLGGTIDDEAMQLQGVWM